MSDVVLGVFAKPPVPGKVKTRLCPPLSPAEAAAFYQVALAETIARFSVLPGELVIFYAGGEDYFRRTFPEVPRYPQGEGDLGIRMERALATLFAAGYRRAALVGSDSPDLPLELITAAFAALHDHDSVTIPARDGGYMLIGESRHLPELFDDIPWSTPDVLAATQRRAVQHGASCAVVGAWDDCDDWPALTALLERSPASATACHVREHLSCYLHADRSL